MLEATSLPIEPVMLMPTNVPDLIWIWATGVTVLLLGFIVYYLREMRSEQKQTNKEIVGVLVKQTTTATQLIDHIENASIHCKGLNCPGIEKRVQQN